MVVQLENHEAVPPLRSIAREFGLDPESPDGQHVEADRTGIAICRCPEVGDKRPSELTGGRPLGSLPAGSTNADGRVRQSSSMCPGADGRHCHDQGADAPGWEEEPSNRTLPKKAIAGAASLIEGTNEEEITTPVGTLQRRPTSNVCAASCFSAFRGRATSFAHRPWPILAAGSLPSTMFRHWDGVALWRSLSGSMQSMQAWTISGDLAGLAAGYRVAAGPRNWPSRTSHGWGRRSLIGPTLRGHFDYFLWKVVERTYSFLAPRFMSGQDRRSKTDRPSRKAPAPRFGEPRIAEMTRGHGWMLDPRGGSTTGPGSPPQPGWLSRLTPLASGDTAETASRGEYRHERRHYPGYRFRSSTGTGPAGRIGDPDRNPEPRAFEGRT